MPLFGMDGKQSHDSLFGQDGLPLRHRVTTMGAVFGKEGKYLILRHNWCDMMRRRRRLVRSMCGIRYSSVSVGELPASRGRESEHAPSCEAESVSEREQCTPHGLRLA
ncbi:hypothetical protein B0H14DRAFT_2596047 [Mycena olivaceomarginata]|nr:hypothetical protein B0H14DRAFT_2596047 [Mycena olivaceomarginata]